MPPPPPSGICFVLRQRKFGTGPTAVTSLCSKEVGHCDRDLGKHCQIDKCWTEDVVRHMMADVTFLEERGLSFSMGHDEQIESRQKRLRYHGTDCGNRTASRKARG